MARTYEKLLETKGAIERMDRRCLALQCDVTKEEEIEKVVGQTVRHYGKIAEFLFFNPSNRGLKGRIEWITKLVEDFSLDGFVMQRSRTCLMLNMGQDDITEALTRKTGLPAVVVEGDVCDSRVFSDTEFNSKIDAFMEILAQRGPQGR